jgi:hypothetical protein
MKQPLALLFLLLAFSTQVMSQTDVWKPLGNDDANKATFDEVNATAVATIGNDIYIAYRDKSASNRLTVRKNSSGLWTDVGSMGFSSGAVINVNMIIDGGGVIYVAYLDSSLTNNLIVKKFAGSSWTDVGAASLPTGTLQLPSMTISQTGTLYISFVDPADTYKVSVIKYDNGSWLLVGGQGISQSYAFYTSIAVDANGIVYMNYGESLNMSTSYIRKFSGGTWTTLTTLITPITSYATENPAIAVDANNNLNVLYRNPTSGRATLTRYNGSTWSIVGSAEFSDNGSSDLRLAIASNNTIYAAYSDYLTSLVTVKYFDGTLWKTTPSTRAGGVSSLSFTTDNASNPILFHNNWFQNAGLVKKYTGSSWEIIGAKGFSGNSLWSAYGTLDTAGTAVVGFSAVNNGNKPAVLKYANNNWTNYSSTSFTDTTVDGFGFKFSSKNEMYVCYHDKRLSNKITVKRFDGTDWDTIGAPGFALVDEYTQFHLASDDTPYLLFQEPTNYWRATVMKFDGTGWVKLGNTAVSPDKVFDLSIATDNNGNVYIAYRNLYGFYGLVIKKFDGTTWSDLGFTPVAGTYSTRPSLAVDDNNNLYVAYSDGSVASKVTVRKYTGSSWQLVGMAGISIGTTENLMLTMKKGIPFVSYIETDGRIAKAKIYDGSSWVNAGQNAISSKGVTSMMLAHSKDKTIAVFANVDGFVKELITPENVNETASQLKPSLVIWPNPASHELSIRCKKGTVNIVTVYGIDGKQYFQGKFDSSRELISIPVNSWQRGMYIVNVVSGKGVESQLVSVE